MKDTKTIQREFKEEVMPEIKGAMALLESFQEKLAHLEFVSLEYEKETRKKTEDWIKISRWLEKELVKQSIENIKNQIQKLEFNY